MAQTRILMIPALLITIISLYGFRQQGSASIIGSWTRAEQRFISHRHGSSVADTTVSHDHGYAITYTMDSQYHYRGPHGMIADGTFSCSDSMIHSVSASHLISGRERILTLDEHTLILYVRGVGIESGIASETLTIYTR